MENYKDLKIVIFSIIDCAARPPARPSTRAAEPGMQGHSSAQQPALPRFHIRFIRRRFLAQKVDARIAFLNTLALGSRMQFLNNRALRMSPI